MKRIGILGGISHESTALYYSQIHAEYFARQRNYDYPEVIVYSLNFQKFTDFEDQSATDPKAKANYIDYILEGLRGLQQAGADFALLAANSPHAVFAQLQERIDLPLLSIVDVTANQAQRMGLQRLLLLGIKFTMQSSFYAETCAQSGLEVITPAVDDQDQINRIIFAELVIGEVRAESRCALLAVIAKHQVDGVILGCTELPMILRPEDTPLPLLNTLNLHVNAALDYVLA